MEKDVKNRLKKNRRRERAERMHAQMKENDSAEDDFATMEKKPPRPPLRRKKAKESLFDEELVDGFAILAFKTYEDLEVSLFIFL